MVELGVVGLQVDRSGEIGHRCIEGALAVVRDAAVVVAEGVRAVDLNRPAVVRDRQVEKADFIVREASVEQGLEVSRLGGDGLGVLLNGLVKLVLLAELVAPCVVLLRNGVQPVVARLAWLVVVRVAAKACVVLVEVIAISAVIVVVAAADTDVPVVDDTIVDTNDDDDANDWIIC